MGGTEHKDKLKPKTYYKDSKKLAYCRKLNLSEKYMNSIKDIYKNIEKLLYDDTDSKTTVSNKSIHMCIDT